jgi:Uma2 family endonuclease
MRYNKTGNRHKRLIDKENGMAAELMEKQFPGNGIEIETPDVDRLVTEDDTPVDNLFSEKQQRLLVEPLYSSWLGGPAGRDFLAAANVALYSAVREPPIVPDMFLSMDVRVAEDWYAKRHRSYFFWEFGKAPEVVVEVVSNREGEEAGDKLSIYARMSIDHYVIFDPLHELGSELLRVYERQWQRYRKTNAHWFKGVQLGLCLWEGAYEGKEATWLRWCDQEGVLIPTGAERAEAAEQRVEEEAQARLAVEAELARLREELARLKQS